MSNPRKSNSKFCFYASLLDAYQNYLDTDELWGRYYGNSDEPKFTPDEWADKQFVELINRINRVPFTNDAVEKGTALNNMVDMLVDKTMDNGQFVLQDDEERGVMTIFERTMVEDADGKKEAQLLNPRSFLRSMVMDFAEYYDGALKQVFTIGTIDTCFGDVDVYGFIDYLLPFSVHDMKTSRMYSAGAYKNHWQHIVYPYALRCQGIEIDRFEYNVTNFKDTFTEVYMFKDERDIPRLRDMCELFINFLLTHKHLITDTKIFNYREV